MQDLVHLLTRLYVLSSRAFCLLFICSFSKKPFCETGHTGDSLSLPPQQPSTSFPAFIRSTQEHREENENAQKHKVAWDYNELLTLNKQIGKYKEWFAVVPYSSTSRHSKQVTLKVYCCCLGRSRAQSSWPSQASQYQCQLATTVSRWLSSKKTDQMGN